MTFSAPQAQDSPTFPAQALLDATDLAATQAAGAGSAGSGVVSGCAVTPNSSGVNLNVNVASGTVVVAGATVAVSAATNVTVGAASTHDRRDIVTVNSSGTVSTTAGTPCSVAGWTTSSGVLGPTKPAIPASSVLLAEVYVPGAATSITASNIVAKAAPIGTSAVTLISSQVLGSAAATVSFSSIPQTYNHLRGVILGRSSTAGLADFPQIQFNGDTAAHYDYEILSGVNALAAAGPTVAQTSILIESVTGATATASVPGMVTFDIPLYAGTTFQKSLSAVGGSCDTTGGNSTRVVGVVGNWRSTAAITSLLINLNSGANFVTGSGFYLYGIT